MGRFVKTLVIAFWLAVIIVEGSLWKVGSNPPGGDCLIDDDCDGSPEKAYCQINDFYETTVEPSGTCACCEDKGYVPVDENFDGVLECAKRRFVNDPCDTNEQCRAHLGNQSECVQVKECRCIDSVSNRNGTKCLEIRNQLDQPCEEPIQCQSGEPGEYSECRSGFCACQPDAIRESPNTHKCLPLATELGTPCSIDTQCTTKIDKSVCISKGEDMSSTCECIDGYVEKSDDKTKCLEEKKIYETCEDRNQCPGWPQDSHTSHCNMLCNCNPGYIPSSNLKRCLQVVNSTVHTCEEPQQCTAGDMGSLSNCINSTCQCNENAVLWPENEKVRCLKKAERVGESCEHHIQCQGLRSSACISGSCACLGETIPANNNTKCLPTVDLEETCEDHVQCSVSNSECSDDECKCKFGFVQPPVGFPGSRNKCDPLAQNINDACEYPEQCGKLENAECVNNNTCQCKPLHVAINSTSCHKFARLNESCENHEECQFGVNKFAECGPNNRCRCNDQTSIEMYNTCNERKKIGDDCSDHLECSASIQGGRCNADGKCGCNPGYFPGDGGSTCVQGDDGDAAGILSGPNFVLLAIVGIITVKII